jgi:gas vesicle protein
MKMIDSSVAEGAMALGKTLLLLTGAEIIDGIARFFNDGNSFSRLGAELSEFAIKAMPFIATMSLVKPEIMQGAEALGKAILSFSGANFVDALTTGIFGAESGLDTFGTKLGTLGSGLKDFAGNLGDFSLEDADKIKTAGEALKAISDTAKDLPNEGGWLAKIVGDNDIGTFASKLGGVGSGISEFINSLNENNIDAQSVEVAKNGCEIIRVLTDVAKDLPNTGGILAAFVGDNDLSDFAGNLGKVAEGIRGYVWELQKDNVITKDSIPIVKTVNDLLWAISDLGEIDLSSTSGNLEELGARLGSFGNKITEYVKGVNTVKLEDYKKASDKIDSILEIANRLSEGNKYADNINKLGNALEKVGKTSIQKFIDAIKGDTTKENAKDAMKNLLNAIADTIEKQSDETVKPKSEKIGKSVKEGVESTKDKMEKVGKDFIQGFANGIKNNLYIATDAGSLIGKSALNAAKQSIDAHSPSKETYKLGTFFDEGFINGVKSLQNKIYNETYGIGDKARLGLSQAIRGVSNLIESGIDDEITIRPILDLSNIESGAKSINGMFGIPSLQVDSNLGAISYGMKLNSQNGGNNNVVSAIEKLSKNLGNVNGDTYNINGVTYGDADKNISDAVQTLVRAARIERRT